jgi:hypothetical protein
MSAFSTLTSLGRRLALLLLLVAVLFFAMFALSPGLELLPDGMDWLVAILLGLFAVIWLVTSRSKPR